MIFFWWIAIGLMVSWEVWQVKKDVDPLKDRVGKLEERLEYLEGHLRKVV